VLNDPVLLHDWHVIARSSDVPEGGVCSARLLGEDLVVWRLNGRVMVWQDLCLHRGTRLSLGQIDGDALRCPYHGWTYNTNGQCIRMPAHPDQKPSAKARAFTYQCQERYGWIWVAPQTPTNDIPVFTEWDNPSYRKIFCGPYAYKAAAPRAVENFLDVAHFPFVHEGFLGDQQHTEIADYEVKVGDDGVTAENITVWQPDPDGTGQGKEVVYTYRVFRPLTAYFIKTSAGPSLSIYLTVTPVDELYSLGWMYMAMNYAHDIPEENLRAFQDEVTGQDIPIVESQRPERLPLDLQAELHLRSDKTSIAYRKWLNELGLTFGTS
jgi:phenylpropionate dioxygenase-like ring-hydroxylating dioxygenase large terminal subunit